MNYGELKTQFSELANRTDLTDEQVVTFIKQGIQRIQRDARLPSMERISLTVVGESFAYIVIPANYIEIKDLVLNGQPLTRTSYRQYSEFKEHGLCRPAYYARLKDRFLIVGTPKEGDEIVLHYYGEFTAFEDDNDENELSASSPDLIIYAALSYAGDFFALDARDAFEARYQQILQSVQDQAIADEFSGGPMLIEPPYRGY